MKRQESNEANQLSRDRIERIRKDNELKNELTLDDLDHLVSENRFEEKHVVGIARCLFKEHGLSFEKQFGVALSLADLQTFLNSSEISEEVVSPFFIAYSKDKGHWVTFCITNYQDGKVTLYKDSMGGEIPSEIKETIEKRFNGTVFKVHENKEQVDAHCDGPMMLRNLKIILEKLVQDEKECIDNFENVLFCSVSDVEFVKRFFREIAGEDIDKTCIELATEIAGTEFTQAVEKLIDLCVDCLDFTPQVEQYDDTLQEKAVQFEGILAVDEKGVCKEGSNGRLKLLHKAELAFDNYTKGESLNYATVQSTVCATELDQFPEQKNKFTRVFKLLGVSGKIHVSERDGTLLQVCEILNIDHNKLIKVYQSLVPCEPDDETTQEAEIPAEVVVPIDIDEIARRTAGLFSQIASVDEGEVKGTKQILAELVIGSDTEEILNETDEEEQELFKLKYKEKPEIEELERKCCEVKRHFEHWKVKSFNEILNWAQINKGKFNLDCLCETVAIMDRANQLVTGHFLRDTQILAVLAFLGCNEGQGQLCQIETGEGKTVIVSLLAAIKVLQGKKVDVITSNGVLAEEGVNTRSNFFGVFGISVAHNNPDESYRSGPRKCYTADVVYGTMGSFQFDYLKDSFEGLRTRGSRKFEFVILDEVDSLLLDDGGHIAKLGEPFPGFDSLKYVYIKIWQEIFKAEKELVKEYKEKLKKMEDELSEKTGIGEDQIQEEIGTFLDPLFHKQDDELIAKIRKSDPANIDLIPVHLRQFARDMVNVWIKNAIYAKYSCHENEQYVIKKLGDDKESKIVPVDYQGTGVTLKTTVWSNGLHQFVQLKHNLHLTSETLTSSLISNIGYVKLYNNNIFGLTGTLGSMAEQQLLSAVYNVGYHKVPTFRSKVFEEISGKVVEDDQFKEVVVQDILKMVEKERSVLIICSTINEALTLEKNITKNKRDSSMKISTYFDENSSAIVQKEIGASEIVISTNIAGRGSDFKTSPELELNGGLHVLVCFLPVNQRVEDQAFGRTSRQGNKGTAQIVMRESEALGLGFTTGQGLPFSSIKEKRDRLEAERLENIRQVELKEIDFHDKIFEQFSNLYRIVMALENVKPRMNFLLKDLKEFWAFWLHKKQNENLALADVDVEFEIFQREARHILGEKKDDKFVGGCITHNPYYSIQQAEHFLENDHLDSAETSLAHAISLSGDYSEMMYPAYIKMFEVSVERGQAVMTSLLTMIKRIVGIDDKSEATAEEDYKKRAKDALKLAKKGLKKEIKYIELHFTGSTSHDFRNIFAPCPESMLAKHMFSKLATLHIYLEHVRSLMAQIETSIATNAAIALSSKVTSYWSSDELPDEQAKLRKLICDEELRDLSLKGLGTMYTIKIVPSQFDLGLMKFGFVQIITGTTVLATGMIFAPAFPIMAKIAETFIFEGVSDIVIAIVTLGEAKIDWKSKLRKYGTAAFSIGISAIVRYTKIAQRAINFCQRLISFLKECPYLEGLCTLLVPVLHKVIVMFEKEIAAQKCQTLTKMFSNVTFQSAASSFIQFLARGEIIDGLIDRSLPSITEFAASIVNRTIQRKALEGVRKEQVLELVSEVLKGTSNNVLKDIVRMLVEYVNSRVKSSNFPESVRLKSASYTEKVCLTLYNKLESLPNEKLACRNSEKEVDEIVIAVAEAVARHVGEQLKKQMMKLINTVELFMKFYNL